MVSTSLSCVLISFCSGIGQLQLMLFMLMVCQSPHAAAVSRILSNWFPAEERGGAFSCINAAVNIVSCTIPLFVSTVLGLSSWRTLFVVVGCLCGGIPLVQMPVLRKTQQLNTAAGPVAKVRIKHPDGVENNPWYDVRGRLTGKDAGIRAVLSSWSMWVVSLSFAALYGVRLG